MTLVLISNITENLLSLKMVLDYEYVSIVGNCYFIRGGIPKYRQNNMQ